VGEPVVKVTRRQLTETNGLINEYSQVALA
jgi:hypothetical protein